MVVIFVKSKPFYSLRPVIVLQGYRRQVLSGVGQIGTLLRLRNLSRLEDAVLCWGGNLRLEQFPSQPRRSDPSSQSRAETFM